MARTKLSACDYVTYGYGQVEPNHLSAQRTGQIYAQLPAAADINVLENGQFVKYDYATGTVNFGGGNFDTGEWMLVYNEPKLYRNNQMDCDFAMLKGDYAARVYSPVDGANLETIHTVDWTSAVTAADPYEVDSTNDPMTKTVYGSPKLMANGTTMVPRVFKTNVGDIFTTNTIKESTLAVGNLLTPGSDGYLAKISGTPSGEMQWQVVKVYTMPDGQKGVKIMRIA